MIQTERINDFEESLRLALKGFAANLWTAVPGIVKSYTPSGNTAGTCTVQPSVQAVVTAQDGTQSAVTLPVLIAVPVVYMGGGSMVTTYPIQDGDEALVVFSSRCIDAWWQSGGVQPQAELRMHDLNDGFAIIGPRSLARAIPNVSTTTAQFRSLDGTTYFEVATGGVANVVAPNGVNIKGPVSIDGAVTITGNVGVTGTVTATEEGTFNSIEVSQHMHTGVTTGGGTSGPPTG
jgi:Phage protein Gp138 N-terminal domain